MLSPGGRTAVLFGRGFPLVLLNVTTGAMTPVTVAGGVAAGQQTLAWSSDGRRLFALSQAGGVVVIDHRTGAVTDLGVSLPFLDALAVRPA